MDEVIKAQAEALEAFMQTEAGISILSLLQRMGERIVFADDAGSLHGHSESHYLCGEGFRRGMVPAYYNNRPINLTQYEATALHIAETAFDDGRIYFSRVSQEKRNNLVLWLVEQAAKLEQERPVAHRVHDCLELAMLIGDYPGGPNYSSSAFD